MNKEVLIVGGGIAGLTAALVLAGQGHSVKLLESALELGGLLRSHARGKWGDFDHGTHVFSETGVAGLDAILFSGLRGSPDWIGHEHCTQDIFFSGHRRRSSFLDVRFLGHAVHERAWREVQALPPPNRESANLSESVAAAYGPTLEQHVFGPLMHKMFGARLEELSADAAQLFGLRRLILGTAEITRELKAAHPWNDARLAFHQLAEGASSTRHFYPTDRGIGLWVEQATARLLSLGVEIMTGIQAFKLELDANGRQVTAIVLSDERRLPCDLLIWSAPAFHLLKLAGLPMPAGVSPPRHRRAMIVDLVLDRPLNSHSHYLTCYEPALRTFRVTNYGALQNAFDRAPAKVTMEVLTDADGGGNITPDDLLSELVAMDLVPADSKILDAWLDGVNHGFPVLTPGFKRDAIAVGDVITSQLENVLLGGRAGGRVFFMKDVLVDMHEQLRKRLNPPA
jgi:phytoene dehydrogenase-like protein